METSWSIAVLCITVHSLVAVHHSSYNSKQYRFWFFSLDAYNWRYNSYQNWNLEPFAVEGMLLALHYKYSTSPLKRCGLALLVLNRSVASKLFVGHVRRTDRTAHHSAYNDVISLIHRLLCMGREKKSLVHTVCGGFLGIGNFCKIYSITLLTSTKHADWLRSMWMMTKEWWKR